ncbi:PhoH family protein [Egicoccus halophilus]|uniref:PhoH-like protein n=1 Tax=Egicoccus halophilus TaxID=1670830 RepID=A0A8J3AI11_9ACTN|nr:PhoH family protein [Egicoccus halophilus]GGI09249.1 phosphate starvation protein PhoH [Egicoccus halophilus]
MSSTPSPLGDPGAAAVPADTVKVLVPGEHSMVSLLGTNDELLKLIEQAFPADIHVRGNEITIATADAVETARVARLFEELVLLLGRGQLLDKPLVRQTIRMIRADEGERPSDVLSEALITHRGRTIRPKTLGQKRYLDAIKVNTVTFGIGPAGTGKTYLAMGAAVQALRAKQVNRLILTRPAVEAGERLGFLPGTLHEKIDPYLKPLWDALHDMMEAEELIAHVDRGTIEVAPLAYMRGRTLNDAFIVLDEAQNTTAEQMKMFLTRIGFNSKAVVTGDVSQVDLPSGRKSGLRIVGDILEGIEGVAFARLQAGDVVRHHIVQRIVEAYAEWDQAQEEAQEARDRGARGERDRRFQED